MANGVATKISAMFFTAMLNEPRHHSHVDTHVLRLVARILNNKTLIKYADKPRTKNGGGAAKAQREDGDVRKWLEGSGLNAKERSHLVYCLQMLGGGSREKGKYNHSLKVCLLNIYCDDDARCLTLA